MGDYIIHKNQHGVLQFIINRPEKRNAINYEIMDGLEKALKECEGNPSIKAFVITGSGEEAFCSGGDLSEFHRLKTEEESYGMLSKMGRILIELAFLPKPTLAFINGTAIGGGCEIAAACDLRIAKKGVKMGFVQGNLAITTGWGGGTLLHKRITSPRALSLLMTASLYETETLVEMGFINELVGRTEDFKDLPLLNALSSKTTDVLQAYKQQQLNGWDRKNMEKNIESEIRQCSKLWAMDEHHQAVDRFLAK
ncbi:enoyl-CoA hydratase/isomerase family protein [Rossellomorea sp. NS-SX7]|uniref:enoyl-CoA hydratase/isomerase family protein n=1 Tax=Rossellomorea sp. NS-SX7 TaxID=3463856 RepID=UPI004058FC72